MTRTRTVTRTILIGLTALLAACWEDEGLIDPTVQNLAGVYVFTGHTTQVHGTVTVVDVLAATPCYQDNRLQIKADGTFVFFDEGVECNPSADHQGTWSLPSRNTMIANGVPVEISFDGKTLIQRIYETTNGITTIRTVIMVKQ